MTASGVAATPAMQLAAGLLTEDQVNISEDGKVTLKDGKGLDVGNPDIKASLEAAFARADEISNVAQRTASDKSGSGKILDVSGDEFFAIENLASNNEVRGKFKSGETSIGLKTPQKTEDFAKSIEEARATAEKYANKKTMSKWMSMSKSDIQTRISLFKETVPAKVMKRFKFSKGYIKQNKENAKKLADANRKLAEVRSLEKKASVPNGGKGWKPVMTASEADKYMGDGGFFGKTSFWHGTTTGGLDNIRNKGVDPSLNTKAEYGTGFYMGISKDIGASYASRFNDQPKVAVGEFRVYSKKPLVVSANQLGKLQQKASGIDVRTAAKAKGYDSIYVTDLGYMIAFDKKQVVNIGGVRANQNEARKVNEKRVEREWNEGKSLNKNATYRALKDRQLTDNEMNNF